jgi:hypothetical protein
MIFAFFQDAEIQLSALSINNCHIVFDKPTNTKRCPFCKIFSEDSSREFELSERQSKDSKQA